MEIKFCRRCGAPVTQQGAGRYICTNDHELFYKAASIATGLFLVDENNHVLLSVRGIEPHKGTLDVPGGFVEFGESLEEGIAREIKEELGLAPDQYDTPQYLSGGMNEYPYGGETLYPYDILFWARTTSGVRIAAQDDIADAQWHNLETLNPEDFSFKTARYAIKLLKEKVL